ncbi:MAG: hypothetical protein A3G71_02835 [Gammaproteobacteria bacterium RIFCSPLOWO2_12_FULL_38_14]|nr:MAG: hypothetical protein A3G71_02835 [Gammaproteobacteria bacterium RIFCSPLOWO2_12_FULL_38_14]
MEKGQGRPALDSNMVSVAQSGLSRVNRAANGRQDVAQGASLTKNNVGLMQNKYFCVATRHKSSERRSL